jgi:hypothetical protein
MGFTLIEPSHVRESEPETYIEMDMDSVPGLTEARTVEQMDEALYAYWGNVRRN